MIYLKHDLENESRDFNEKTGHKSSTDDKKNHDHLQLCVQ